MKSASAYSLFPPTGSTRPQRPRVPASVHPTSLDRVHPPPGQAVWTERDLFTSHLPFFCPSQAKMFSMSCSGSSATTYGQGTGPLLKQQ